MAMTNGDCHLFSAVLEAELRDIERKRRGPSAGTENAPPESSSRQPGERHVEATPAPKGSEPHPEVDLLERQMNEEKKEREVQEKALRMGLTGLALSGGGIRSATFALGILQGFASRGLLRRFDYLSTVSGGGYIGSWLATWIQREGQIDSVEQQLHPSRSGQAQGRAVARGIPYSEEPEPIAHLRAYSSYLAPRRGIFSADSWVLAAVYLRNILLNLLVFLPLITAALLAPRLLEPFYNWGGSPLWDNYWLWLMFSALLVALICILLKALVGSTPLREWAAQTIRLQVAVRFFYWLILFPLFVFAVIVSWELGWDLAHYNSRLDEKDQAAQNPSRRSFGMAAANRVPPAPDTDASQRPWWEWCEQWLRWDHLKAWEQQHLPGTYPHLSGTLLFGVIWGALVGLVYVSVRVVLFLCGLVWSYILKKKGTWRDGIFSIGGESWSLLASLLAGFAGGVLLYLVFGVMLRGIYGQPYDVAFMASLGPPLVVGIILVTVILAVGLLGTVLGEDEREWWGSLGGWLLILTLAWVLVVGLSLFGPLLIMAVPAGVRALLGSGWVATALGGVLAGKSARTSTWKSTKLLEWLTLLGPPVFLVGLLALVALLIDTCQQNPPPSLVDPQYTGEQLDGYFETRATTSAAGLGAVIVGAVVFAFLAALRVDVNAFSLHGLYADRLVRCYLGASRPKARQSIDRLSGAPANSQVPVRQPDPITGFDPEDDFPLAWLQTGLPHPRHGGAYWGPYPLLNTTLNLVQGDELAWQERKGDSFVLSPAYCGSRSTGYRHLDPSDQDALRLGMAVALSGAAVSPNMGYHSSPAVTALLTLFNVRLGGWARNTREGTPGNSGPWQGLLYLLKELFGRTNARAGYVYLSDGGHFENLGIYELVRRRCHCIVACDGEEDAGYAFNGLASAVRKCRTDLGVPITIDLAPLHSHGPDRLVGGHWAIGQIHYEEVHPGASPGVLIYLKASLTGDEPADVQNYAREHRPFPHQTTADQFFTESQFESYRALGCHIAEDFLGNAVHGGSSALDRCWPEGTHDSAPGEGSVARHHPPAHEKPLSEKAVASPS
jgi:hypothetical protein